MTVNPPEPRNFEKVKVPAETIPASESGVTVEHPNAVYYPDLQAVQLEIHASNVEGREPNFKQFPENAVRAAGFNPKTGKPVGEDDKWEANPASVGQTPIVNESGIVNERDDKPNPGTHEELNNPKSSVEFADGEYDGDEEDKPDYIHDAGDIQKREDGESVKFKDGSETTGVVHSYDTNPNIGIPSTLDPNQVLHADDTTAADVKLAVANADPEAVAAHTEPKAKEVAASVKDTPSAPAKKTVAKKTAAKKTAAKKIAKKA